MSAPERTHYQAMGLRPSATPSEVREAYLRLARTLHPDRYFDASETEQRLVERRMREVNAAWEVLGSPERRGAYDESLRPAEPRRASTPPAPPRPRPPMVEDDDDWTTEAFDPEDDVELAPITAFLLRRGPVIVALFIALGLFIGTAYAGGRRAHEPDPSPPPTSCVVSVTPAAC